MDPAPATAPRLAPDAPLSIVVNAGSGRDDADAACATIREVLDAAGRRHAIRCIDEPARHADIVAAAVDEAQAHGGAVVAVGGDGTLNSVAAQAVARQLP